MFVSEGDERAAFLTAVESGCTSERLQPMRRSGVATATTPPQRTKLNIVFDKKRYYYFRNEIKKYLLFGRYVRY